MRLYPNQSTAFIAFWTTVAFLFVNIAMIKMASGQTASEKKFHYWHQKMTDPEVNYNELVLEFENFWRTNPSKDKKEVGYKHFMRWQDAYSGMADGSGNIIPMNDIIDEYKKFDMLYGIDAISGDWEFLGPDQVPEVPGGGTKTGIGRIMCVAFHPTEPNTLFVGSSTSGIWKSTTGGSDWDNMNTDGLLHFGVSSIAVQASNPDVIYLGTGDRDAGEVPGQGVWKTTDGGWNWFQLSGSIDNKTINKVLIQPNWSEAILAATESGVFRSTNSGSSWSFCSGISGNILDVEYKPGDPDVVYATGNGKFYRSENAGISWSVVSYPLNVTTGRAEVAVTAANPEKVFVFAEKESEFFALFVSPNSGQGFTSYLNNDIVDEGQGGFNLAFGADPTDEDVLHAGMVNMFKTEDGGYNWLKLTGSSYETHADYHAFEFSPHTNDVYAVNDGGLYYSDDDGASFSCISDGLNILQVNRIAVSNQDPDMFLAGSNHCGTVAPVAGNIIHVSGGDGMTCAIDYTDDQYLYASAQEGNIRRSISGAEGSWSSISSGIPDSAGWFRPFILDHQDPNIMFAGETDVWRSSNVKAADPASVAWSNISTGQLSSEFIERMEQCKADGNIIYITEAKGVRVYRTDNAYAAVPVWTELPKPNNGVVYSFETHPTDPDIVYVVTKGRQVLKSYDRGNSWTDITGNLPDLLTLYCIEYHEGSNEGLLVGTMAGIYYKDADMTHWVEFKKTLPRTPVKRMAIRYASDPDQLYVGTWGRGVWRTDLLPDMKPNLTINSATATVSQTEVQINIGLYNDASMGDAESYITGYYLSTNSVVSPGDILIGKDTIEAHPHGIIIGEGHNVDVGQVEPEIASGSYFIGAFADINDSITETNETDNTITCANQITIPEPPDPPTNILATDGTQVGKVIVTWDPPASAYDLYFMVYRGLSANSFLAQPVGDTWFQGTEYEDQSAISGANYYYWVRAANNPKGLRASGMSGWNAGWGGLQAPIYCSATKGQFDDRIRISWNPPDGATHYMVYRNTVLDVLSADPLFTTWITADEFDDFDVVLEEEYYYWAKSALSEAGYRACTGWSNATSGYLGLVGAPDPVASDGTNTDGIDISWNTVDGATHYKLFHNTQENSSTSTALTDWIDATTWFHADVDWGTYHYYWVKAAMDDAGFNESAYGYCDSGWRKYYPVENLLASEGTSTDHVELTWDNTNLYGYYRVSRGQSPLWLTAQPISDWLPHEPGVLQVYQDTIAIGGKTYYYWLNVSNDAAGEFTSGFGPGNSGWRKLYAPVCDATYGVYSDKIRISWDPVPGAVAYRLMKNTVSQIPPGAIVDWTTDFFEYEDPDVEPGYPYYYFVQAAINEAGDRPSYFCTSEGMAEKCGNLLEDPNYRYVHIKGETLQVSGRVYNEGPWGTGPMLAAITLQSDPLSEYEYLLGYKAIPALGEGEYVNFDFEASMASIPYGEWYVGMVIPSDPNTCQTNPDDDVIVWDDVPFEFTDALFGIYTIGGNTPDFQDFESALNQLHSRGISDDVTFHVHPETYYEQIHLTSIDGAGPNCEIRFMTEPLSADTAEIYFCSNTENYTVLFDGASYITLENLKITSPGYTNNVSTYGKVISLQECSHISLLGNRIEGSADYTFNSGDNAVIYSNNFPCHDILIEGNDILYGSYGIFIHGVGEGPDQNQGIQVRSNIIRDFNNMGITLKYHMSPSVTNNEIHYKSTPITQVYGIYLDYISANSEIKNNKVIMEPSAYINIGVNVQNCIGSPAARAMIANNFITLSSSGGVIYGLILFNSVELDALYNSVHIHGVQTSESFCLYPTCTFEFASTYNNMVYNNILSNEVGGLCILYPEISVSEGYCSACDYNDLFYTGDAVCQYGLDATIPDLGSWTSLSGFDSHSISIDPAFFSDTDLHTQSPELDGKALPQALVTDDIDSETRDPSTPDIGADEFTPPAGFDLSLKVYLEGPFNGEDMNTFLNSELPLDQPYDASPWNYEGSESTTLIPDPAIVDWLLVEVRDATDAGSALQGTVVGRQAGFLKDDGSIVGMDGTDLLHFDVAVENQLFVVIWHRNHLGVLSALPLAETSGTYSYDFSTSGDKAYGGLTGFKELAGGIFGMISGDANGDGVIDGADRAAWESGAGSSGYMRVDLNLDVQADNKDKNDHLIRNESASSQVPE